MNKNIERELKQMNYKTDIQQLIAFIIQTKAN